MGWGGRVSASLCRHDEVFVRIAPRRVGQKRTDRACDGALGWRVLRLRCSCFRCLMHVIIIACLALTPRASHMCVRRCGRVWAWIYVGACMDRRALQADRQTDGAARDRIRAPEYREVSGGPACSGLGSATWLSRSPCTRAHVLILARAILTLHNKLCSCCSAAATEAHAAALTLALWLRFPAPSSRLPNPAPALAARW